MMKRSFSLIVLIAFVLALLGSVANTVKADDGKTLTYGDTLTGEITADVFEENYRFTGKKDDLVGIEMTYDHTGALTNGAIFTVAAPDGNAIGKANWQTSGGDLRFLFLKLPVDGDYTIKAGREKQEKTDQVGTYKIHLFLLPVLKIGEDLSGELTIDADGYVYEGYYVVVSKEDFRLDLTLGKLTSSGGIEAQMKISKYVSFNNSTLLRYETSGYYLSQSVVLPGDSEPYLVRLQIGNYVSMKDEALPSLPYTISLSSPARAVEH